jgi:hypothetical protein
MLNFDSRFIQYFFFWNNYAFMVLGMKTAIMMINLSFVVLSTLGVLVATMYSKGVANWTNFDIVSLLFDFSVCVNKYLNFDFFR